MKKPLRDYLITLCLATVIFTVVAFFLIQAAEGLMGDVVSKIGSENPVETVTSEEVVGPGATDSGNTPGQKQEDVVATFLLMGIDYNKKNADAIFLVGINSTQKKATVTLIPSNTLVNDGGKKYRLGELYSSRSSAFFVDFVAQQTGVKADFSGAMTMSGLANLIDFLGGISYTVPENMYYFDPVQNLKINLKKGSQVLNGDQAVQLVAYRGYAKGNSAREDTQLSFAKSFCTTFLKPENLSRAKAILYNLYYNLDTDFTEADLNALGDVIFQFNSYEQKFARIPGAATSDGFYTVSTSNAAKMLEIYK